MSQKHLIYAKAGCPFTFRFMLFLNDVDNLSDYDILVVRDGEASHADACKTLEAATGEKASFPSMKLVNGDVLVGSTLLMEWVAEKNGVPATPGPIIDYFNQHMAPVSRQLLQRLRSATQKLAALES